MSATNNSVLSGNHVKLSLKLVTKQSLLGMSSMSRTLSPWMWLKWITLKLEKNLQMLLQLLEMRLCVMAAVVNNCFATLRAITWECFGNSKNQHLFQTMWRTEADSGAWEFVVDDNSSLHVSLTCICTAMHVNQKLWILSKAVTRRFLLHGMNSWWLQILQITRLCKNPFIWHSM